MIDTNKRPDHNGGYGGTTMILVCDCTHMATAHDPACSVSRGRGTCSCDGFNPAADQPYADTLTALSDFVAEHHYAPSVRQLATLTGARSPATVHERLARIEAAGLIERVGPRAIKIKEMT